jgi:electron transfer flavoprotein alpha subunit
MANVLVFAETRKGELRKVALEAVTAGRKLAHPSGGGEVLSLIKKKHPTRQSKK